MLYDLIVFFAILSLPIIVGIAYVVNEIIVHERCERSRIEIWARARHPEITDFAEKKAAYNAYRVRFHPDWPWPEFPGE